MASTDTASNASPVRAIVVGAGVSGAFAADTLRRSLGRRLDLTVLEATDQPGGRARRCEVAGVKVEMGASLFHSANRLLDEAAGSLGLSVIEAASGAAFGIWDGSGWPLRTGGGRLDELRLVARYRRGLLSAGRTVRDMVARLGLVYPRLAAGDSWNSPESLLRDLGLYGWSQVLADEHFPAGRFRDEFIDGVSRNNYAQDASGLNALVELVSLAGAGLGGGSLRRVAEGNQVIPAGLVARSGAHLLTQARVRSVRSIGAGPGGGWRVAGTGFPEVDADVVVLAAPLEDAGIDLGPREPPRREFATVHVTFVEGTLRLGAEGEHRLAPDFVLTTAAAGPLLSIERIAEAAGGALYKVFSTEPLADQRLGRLFVVRDVVRLSWSAYPLLSPTDSWPDFRLAAGLYYTGAMEYAVSTMETQAIGGVAVANLAVDDLAHRPG